MSKGSAPLAFKLILTHWFGPNSEIAVSAIAKNRKMKTGLNMALKLLAREFASAMCDFGNVYPKNKTA